MSFSGGRGGGRWSSSNFSGGGRYGRGGGGGNSGGGPFSRGSGGGGRGGRQHSSHGPSSAPQSAYDGALSGGGGSASSQMAQQPPPPRLKPCSYYVSTGACTNNPCHFAHVVKMHAAIEASATPSPSASPSPSAPAKKGAAAVPSNRAPVSNVALYQNLNTNSLQIFASSHDGTWRVYNAARSFAKELEHTMSSSSNASSNPIQQHRIGTLTISSSVLFCGFEGAHVQLPHVLTGMIFAWNLHSPQDPPLEFHMGPNIPFAHTSCVTCIITFGSDVCISGSMDGTIRIWTFTLASSTSSSPPTPSSTKCTTTLCGHVGEITGLVLVGNSILWSSSLDRTLRLWDLASNQCVHVITPDSTGGHVDAITCLLSYTSTVHGHFIFSGSLDTTIKVWNPNTGECVASTSHGVGVTCMDSMEDAKGHGLILVGTTSGKIMIRNILPTSTTPDFFTLLCSLDARYTYCGHEGLVKCIKAGPAHTFYSGGADGFVCVWEITGDLGL